METLQGAFVRRLYDNYNENENDNEKLITSLRHI